MKLRSNCADEVLRFRLPIVAAAVALCLANVSAGQETLRIGERLGEVGIDQHLNGKLPGELAFRDSLGREVQLGDYLGRRPLVLMFVYYRCPMLCNVALTALLQSAEGLPLDAGRDFDVVAISIDPSETPSLAETKRQSYLRRYSRPTGAQGWHFLTGDADSIAQATRAVGFRYFYDEKTSQFVHAAGLVVVTPDGRLARYLYGVDYAPQDLRLAIVEASAGRVGSTDDQLLLLCYHYDPTTGRYGLAVLRIMRAAGMATALGVVVAIGFFLYRERRKAPRQAIPITARRVLD